MDYTSLYFDWMCELVFPNIDDRRNYSELLNALHGILFYYSIPMDENRMRDGIDLRYRFIQERGYSEREVYHTIQNGNSCSMLEMMVALALKGDDRVLYDYETGSKAFLIFTIMLESLQIAHMVNIHFDIRYVEYRIDRLLNRDYDFNGNGGLFTVENPRRDMRHVDIWYQMNWKLQEIYK